MGDKKNIPEFIDKRLQSRLVDRGEISQKALSDYLTKLPDLADDVDFVSLGGEPEATDGETA